MSLKDIVNLNAPLRDPRKHDCKIFYSRFRELITSDLTFEEMGQVFMAGMMYEVFGTEYNPDSEDTQSLFPTFTDRTVKGQYVGLLEDFKRLANSYDETCHQNSVNAQKGWEKRKAADPSPSPAISQGMSDSDINDIAEEMLREADGDIEQARQSVSLLQLDGKTKALIKSAIGR